MVGAVVTLAVKVVVNTLLRVQSSVIAVAENVTDTVGVLAEPFTTIPALVVPPVAAVIVTAAPLEGAFTVQLPVELIVPRAVVLVASARVLAADKYRPLDGTVEPDGINAVAVALPVVAKPVPLNVKPLLVVSALVLLAYTMPLAVKLVRPVPPFVVGKVPLTCEVRLTPERVPPRVRLPELVTVPVNVIPLTVPVPPTEVTVPPDPVAESVPPAKETPDPIVTLLNPPNPFP